MLKVVQVNQAEIQTDDANIPIAPPATGESPLDLRSMMVEVDARNPTLWGLERGLPSFPRRLARSTLERARECADFLIAKQPRNSRYR
jgi:hypothetical protein